jgi:putative ABC transport system ATP-binding protein
VNGSGAIGLSIEGLRVDRGGRAVLEVSGLELPAGSQSAIVGPSGCGKTTLLSVLAGLLPPSAGRVRIGDTDLGELRRSGELAVDRFRARHVGLVPQQPLLFGVLGALDNLLIARHFAGLPPEREAARALLARLGLVGLEQRRPRELSRGQQQRVALARALVVRPALILADEPTANLDDDHARVVLDLLAGQAREAGATLLVATHDARVRDRLPVALALPARGSPPHAAGSRQPGDGGAVAGGRR